jgi:hypothetical protein
MDVAPSPEAMTDAIFEKYHPQRLSVAGAKDHPGSRRRGARSARWKIHNYCFFCKAVCIQSFANFSMGMTWIAIKKK